MKFCELRDKTFSKALSGSYYQAATFDKFFMANLYFALGDEKTGYYIKLECFLEPNYLKILNFYTLPYETEWPKLLKEHRDWYLGWSFEEDGQEDYALLMKEFEAKKSQVIKEGAVFAKEYYSKQIELLKENIAKHKEAYEKF